MSTSPSAVTADYLKSLIREVPDFPKKGILFYDITTLLQDPAGLHAAIDSITVPFRDQQIDLVVGIESRGFIFGGSEIYGGVSGFWDYGPPGVELRDNIRRLWWRVMVQLRDDVVGLDDFSSGKRDTAALDAAETIGQGGELADAAAAPAQAIGPARDRSGDFDPITGRDLDWPWPRLNESRAPATVRSNQGLGAEGAADMPVLACQELDQALPPGLEGCFLQFCRRMLPIDLLDNQKVSGIDVQTLGSSQVREITTLDVCLKAMSGDLRYTFDAVERPAPALVGMEAQVVQAAMDSVETTVTISDDCWPVSARKIACSRNTLPKYTSSKMALSTA